MGRFQRRVSVAAAALAVLISASLTAQTTPISIVNGTYSENFNSMGTGTPVYPSGWNGFKAAGTSGLGQWAFITTATNPAFTTNNGSLGTGTVYNYGGGADPTDRALGSLGSGQTAPGFGLLLVNNTGRTLTSADILVSFRAEQWRTGSSNTSNEFLTFQWLTGNTSLDVNNSAGTNTDAALNINEIQTGTTTSVAIDGNAAGNFTTFSGTIAGFIWFPGDRLYLRWLDFDDAGSDAGMAIDDFSFMVLGPVPEPTAMFLCGGVLTAFFIGRWKRRTAA